MSRLLEKKKTKMDTTEGSMTSYWIKFFKTAGVPVSDAANYALAFSDNRIQKEMLMDLTKEYLNDMGITRLGDVIAILKHAKSVHGEDAREKILQSETRGSPVLLTASARAAARASPSRSPVLGRKPRSTPASRLVEHYTGNDPQALPLNQPSPPPSSRVALPPAAAPSAGMICLNPSRQKEVVPVPKKRRVFPEHEGKYKVFMPSGTTAKTKKILEQKRLSITEKRMGTKNSVFERLGRDSPTADSSPAVVTVTGLDKVVMRNTDDLASSVFGRLGSKTTIKRAATSTSDDLLEEEDESLFDDAPLKYEGVLKTTAKKAKPSQPSNATQFSITIKSAPFPKKLSKTVKVDKEEGSLASDQVAVRNLSVKNRLGGVVSAPASSTTSGAAKPAVKPTTIKLTTPKALLAKPKQLPSKNRLASLNKPVGVRKRLGVTGEVSSSSHEEVTSTAGKKNKATTVVKSKGIFGRLGQQV